MESIRVRLGSTNVYALVDGGSVLLVDAGPDYAGAWEELAGGLTRHGIGAQDVRAVVLTHGHRDHAGLAARWQRAGAAVWAGRGDAAVLALDENGRQEQREAAARVLREFGVPGGPHLQPHSVEGRETLTARGEGAIGGRRVRSQAAVRQDAAPVSKPSRPDPGETPSLDRSPAPPRESQPPKPNPSEALSGTERAGERSERVRSVHGIWPGPLRMTPVTPDRLLDDGDRTELGRISLSVIACPGHTPGSILLPERTTGAVYTGDHLLPHTVATVGIQVENGERVPTMPLFLRSLRRARELGAVPGFPGHGELMPDTAAAADWSLRYLERRASRLRRLREERDRSAWKLAGAMFPHLRPEHMAAVMAEVIGLLDVMQEDEA